MNRSEQINELASALAKFQGACPTIEKNKTVSFSMKSGGKTQFNYADLAVIWKTIRKPLSDAGLSVVQGVAYTEGMAYMETMVSHTSGQWMSTFIKLERTGQDDKELGSHVTYLRRYALSMTLGLVSDDDIDAVGDMPDVKAVTDRVKPKIVTVTPEQCLTLKDAIDGDNDLLGDILGAYAIKSLGELPVAEFERCMKGIDKRKAVA